jgi:biotin carboxyl carrier protein
MMRQNRIRLTVVLVSALSLANCGGKKEVVETVKVKVPVTITHPSSGPISESIVLTATSSYQRKNIVSASMQGYVIHIDVAVGDRVEKGQSILVMQTKESHALSMKSIPDSLKEFTGKVTIPASASGIVTSILRQSGDYVQDGEQVCVISDIESFAFVLSVPYDYNRYMKIGETSTLILPDSMHIPARIEKKLATVDAASQTQNYLLVPSSGVTVPENVIAQVSLPTNRKDKALMLPKQAVLADERMQNFWVMQLKSDSIAVSVPVKKGIETDSQVEILSPVFSKDDRFVLTGNYGMEDTAFVIIKE